MRRFCVCFIIIVFQIYGAESLFRIFPEDVATGFAAIYGFSPRLLLGKDHRFGFGFRFGNHADLQLMYELGPQLTTRPLQPTRYQSGTVRQRTTQRRPILELLLRAGLFKNGYDFDYNENELDEPR